MTLTKKLRIFMMKQNYTILIKKSVYSRLKSSPSQVFDYAYIRP